jgi:polyisoprenyl-teichoic acid--peptidoglycan teichoic acid transferase
MRRRGRALDAVLYCLAAIVVGAGGAGVYDMVVHADTGPGGQSTGIGHMFSSPLAGMKEVRILLVGSDDRKDDKGRADSLMVFFLNPQTKRAALLSFPRDLYVPIPGHGDDKINHSYAFGGVPMLRGCIDGVIGEPVTYYAHCTFDSFVKAIDLLGGVDVDVPDYEGKGFGMNYDCPGDNLVIHLRPGPQHLTGYKAMGFARFRHSNVPGKSITDTQRASNQQAVLKGIVEQKLRPSNAGRLLKTAGYILNTIDTDVPWRVAADLARILRTVKSEDLYTATVPITDHMRGLIYYADVDQTGFDDVMRRVKEHLAGAPLPATVEVLNGTGRAGAASQAATVLQSNGFVVKAVANGVKRRTNTTVIEYAKGKGEVARKASEVLGAAGAQVRLGDSTQLGRADLRITLGKDARPRPS